MVNGQKMEGLDCSGESIHYAYCKLCDAQVKVSVGSSSALKSHADGKEHKKLVKNGEAGVKSLAPLHFFKNALPTPSKSSPPSHSGATAEKIYGLLIPIAVQKAEIRWVIKTGLSGFSFRSCLNVNSLFGTMFEDSEIAKSFKMSKTNCAYVINFGIAPNFKKILTHDIS